MATEWVEGEEEVYGHESWGGEFYAIDGTPRKCTLCGSEEFTTVVKDMLDHHVAEEEWYCLYCGTTVAYWAYGYFDPAYGEDADEL